MITVWGRKSSSNVQVVLWCLQELELECSRIDAGFTYGVTDTDDYLSMNLNGYVPALQDGSNDPLFESCAICRYLASTYAAERFKPNNFWPDNLASRATVDMWAEWARLNVAQNFSIPLFWPKVRLAPEQTSSESIAAALDKLNKFLKIADTRLSNSQYLVSDDLTLADVIFGHSLYRYYDIDIPRADFANLERYYYKLGERAAYRNTVMVSYDELRYKS